MRAVAVDFFDKHLGVIALAGQTTVISGDFTYTNDILITYFVENAVSLFDLHGFITRDKEWQLPLNSQVLGWLNTVSALAAFLR